MNYIKITVIKIKSVKIFQDEIMNGYNPCRQIIQSKFLLRARSTLTKIPHDFTYGKFQTCGFETCDIPHVKLCEI